MKNKLKILCASLLIVAVTSQAEVGDFQITLKVIDDSGKPLPGINVGASLVQTKSPLATITAQNIAEKQIDVITDKEGMAIVTDSGVADRNVYYGIKPTSGYYYSTGGDYTFQKVENGKWQPWNPTVELVLKPIINPVPMYAKKVWNTSLPENNKPIGYDLEIGDWVAPYGKGLTADFIFTLDRKFTSVTQDFNATLTLTFPNDGDGIQSVMSDSTGSLLRIPRSAPEDGYESKLVLQMSREDGKPMVGVLANPDQNYFFRVRTKKDHQGNIVSTKYGKISGGIGWDIFHSSTAKLRFTYYLNPKLNSQNMEFDSKQNLFKNQPSLERVTAP